MLWSMDRPSVYTIDIYDGLYKKMFFFDTTLLNFEKCLCRNNIKKIQIYHQIQTYIDKNPIFILDYNQIANSCVLVLKFNFFFV